MDPAGFPSYFPMTPLTPLRQYPFSPATPSAPTNRGMIFYPQLPTAEPSESPPASADSVLTSAEANSKKPMDKKLRRQIANCNERRRMQSINTGFHTLRLLMPHLQGEKLSKAAVLQHASEFIYRLNQDRERLVQQNASLRMMLAKYWPAAEQALGEPLSENKVNKATSPMVFDDEKAANKELEQIFKSQRELERMREELKQERALRLSLEARCKNQTPSEEELDNEDVEESTDSEEGYKSKRPRINSSASNSTPEPKNNLDIIVRAIRQIEGDAFSRSATPTCSSQERKATKATFVPISSTKEGSRVSPVTPVCAS